jgi:hypothetical protein
MIDNTDEQISQHLELPAIGSLFCEYRKIDDGKSFELVISCRNHRSSAMTYSLAKSSSLPLQTPNCCYLFLYKRHSA